MLHKSLAWLAEVSLVMDFVNTGGAGSKELLWSVLCMAIGETGCDVWILARAEAKLNVGGVDSFLLALLVSMAGLSVGSVNSVVPWKREVFTLGETVLHMLSGFCYPL